MVDIFCLVKVLDVIFRLLLQILLAGGTLCCVCLPVGQQCLASRIAPPRRFLEDSHRLGFASGLQQCSRISVVASGIVAQLFEFLESRFNIARLKIRDCIVDGARPLVGNIVKINADVTGVALILQYRREQHFEDPSAGKRLEAAFTHIQVGI